MGSSHIGSKMLIELQYSKKLCFSLLVCLMLMLLPSLFLLRASLNNKIYHIRFHSQNVDITGTPLKQLVEMQAKEIKVTAAVKTVTVAVADHPVLDMFLNWYNSAKRVGIHNILPIALDSQLYQELKMLKIPAYLDRRISYATKEESGFMTNDFKLKGKMKFILTLDVLQLGYAVLLSDLDIYFLQNPFPFLNCLKCDFEYQAENNHDKENPNVGFILFRPTQNTINFLEILVKKLDNDNTLWDQSAFAQMLWAFSIPAKQLDPYIFPSGWALERNSNGIHKMIFKESKQSETLVLPPSCKNAVLYHNTWKSGLVLKTYRFREMGMWTLDTPNSYYSSKTRKYFTYENPWKHFASMENDILYFTLQLGQLFNRTLILPKFHCHNGKNAITYPCSLMEVEDVEVFDKVSSRSYREHSFLSNKLVPDSVKKSISPQLFILSQQTFAKFNIPNNTSVKMLTPKSLAKGPTREELLKWHREFSHFAVLRFHSLYLPVEGLKEKYLQKVKPET